MTAPPAVNGVALGDLSEEERLAFLDLTRRVIDSFFVTEKIEPKVVMDTENVEIIKAMVKTGLGISIVPYQAFAASDGRSHPRRFPNVTIQNSALTTSCLFCMDLSTMPTKSV